jgi:hypothetical protein
MSSSNLGTNENDENDDEEFEGGEIHKGWS